MRCESSTLSSGRAGKSCTGEAFAVSRCYDAPLLELFLQFALPVRQESPMRHLILVTAIALFFAESGYAGPQTVETLNKHLKAGTLSAAEMALAAELEQRPEDAQARFGLGTVQFLRTVEKLAQSLYRHGMMQQHRSQLVNLDIPVPMNPKPEKINYQQARQLIQDFVTGLAKAEATLAKINAEDVHLPIRFGMIRLDLDGDGTPRPHETLWTIYAQLNRLAGINEEVASRFVINFDTGDVYWLRGYCHLLMAIGETALAHDWQQLFQRVGHVLFPVVDSPYAFLTEPTPGESSFLSFTQLSDFIAFVHLINFKVESPARLKAALQHLEAMVEVSSKSWDFILQETDNEDEWLPNPKQQGVLPNVVVTEEMIATWRHFLAESKLILQGKKLIPFWRGTPGRGFNLRRVYTEPQPFDLVMWVQGTGAAPYLEPGELTDQEVWNRLLSVFGGNFIGFAIWFN